MAGDIIFRDNSSAVMAQYERKVREALERIGLVWIKNVTNTINSRFGSPIVDSGRMRASMKFEVDLANKRVRVGTDISDPPYPIFVELGTHKMPARGFLRASVMEFISDYEQAIRQAFGSGWDVSISS